MFHWPSMFDSRDLQHGSPPQRRPPRRNRRVSRSAHRNPVVERKSLSSPLPSQSNHCLGNARLQPLAQERLGNNTLGRRRLQPVGSSSSMAGAWITSMEVNIESMTICRGQLGTSGKQFQKCNILRQNVNFKLSDVTALQEDWGFALFKRIKHSAGLPTRSHPWSNRPASEGRCKRGCLKIGGGQTSKFMRIFKVGAPTLLIIPKLFCFETLVFPQSCQNN